MPVYQFESIAAAQALAFNSNADELRFTGVTATQVVVTGSPGNLTLTLGSRSVTFGATFSPPLSDTFVTAGQLTFPDGSKLRVGTSGADSLSGSPGRDQLLGGDGNDTLSSGDGADLLYGGAGDDLLRPGFGTETIDGGAGIDTLSFEGVTVAVTASLFPSATGPQVSNVENLIGAALNDKLTGDGQNNSLVGGAGSDTIDAGFGADTLDGGDGADDLSGGGGDDVIRAGAGQDVLRGGDGVDQFVFAQGGTSPTAPDTVADWSSEDRILTGAVAGAYQETTAPDSGRIYADSLIAAGARYVAVQTPAGVIVYVDTAGDRGTAEDAILLSGRTLDDISAVNLGAIETLPTAPPAPAEPGQQTPAPAAPDLPAAPQLIANGGFSASLTGNIDSAHLSSLLGLTIQEATSTTLRIGGSVNGVTVGGSGLTYDQNDQIVGGTVTSIVYGDPSGFQALVRDGAGVSATAFGRWVATDATLEAFSTILARNDRITGGGGADLIRGYDGADLIEGRGGGGTVFGGAGNDVIYAVQAGLVPSGVTEAATYLRGDEGDDYIIGGAAFDDINGNMGNDTASGGAGEDWVVGGKDNDLLFGGGGSDLVYGNIGADTCDGNDGNDIVRGGQDNDQVFGGAGDDYVSGDKGSDTMTGGAGADIFHSFGDAGLDRVTDFSLAQGDRVQLDPGTQYTVSQSGADTVINMTGGGQMILVGVQMSSLTAGWIFGA